MLTLTTKTAPKTSCQTGWLEQLAPSSHDHAEIRHQNAAKSWFFLLQESGPQQLHHAAKHGLDIEGLNHLAG